MTVNAGIIGVGVIGQDHARRLTGVVPGAVVTAVTDADGDRARAVAQSLPAALALPTGHDVIAAGDVDAVLVTAPGPAHEEFVLAAIGAGKPVFCEKPLAPTAEACLRIMEAEMAAGGRLVQVGFMRRYDGGYLALKQAIDAGAIGAPLLVHCVHRNASVPATYTSDMPITDSAPHEMDIVRWLLGDEVTAVSVLIPRRSSHAPARLHDPQILLMETRGGVHVDVEVFVNCRYGYDIRCEVVGETGTVSLAHPAAAILRSSGTLSEPVAGDWRDRFALAYDAELAAWVNSVTAGRPTGPSCWDGYAAAAVSEAALAALASGERTGVVMKDRPPFYT
ncbi:MAG TPA: Gfo/Idh/MocA family oxidoreductase [Streptosporangiaceae bacterium]|jgi:myo-inositol 2-dehydrogenase/D-chiro-inositol 1-dehydrogenase|nr:Gfo/Idh/MocA family oxidoreductase [Streptosporangiaceae bacterium]